MSASQGNLPVSCWPEVLEIPQTIEAIVIVLGCLTETEG